MNAIIVILLISCIFNSKFLSNENLLNAEVEQFVGIRYAEPPIGSLRFEPAKLKLFNDSVLFNKEHCKACIQVQNPLPLPFFDIVDQDEDCLCLDLWRPKHTSQINKLPVFVQIHGGAFNQGSSSLKIYDGSKLALTSNAIIINIQYRLGILGFTAFDKQNVYGTGSLNGILDQITALKWINLHISKFGGDVNNISVFGESAGGISTCILSVTPLAKGLFNRAIIQSGPCLGSWFHNTMKQSLETGRKLLSTLGVNNKEEAKLLPVDKLRISLNDTLGLDGQVLEISPYEYMKKGQVNVQSLIIGHNSRDGVQLFIPSDKLPTKNNYDSVITKYANEKHLDHILDYYPMNNENPIDQQIKADSDYSIKCPTMIISNVLKDKIQLFRQELAQGPRQYDQANQVNILPKCSDSNIKNCIGWTSHGTDIMLIQGNFRLKGLKYNVEENDLKLHQTMVNLWSSFMSTGIPIDKSNSYIWLQQKQNTNI